MYQFVLAVMFCFGESNDLVVQLGDEDFAVREEAYGYLLENVNFSWYIKLRDFKTDDLELVKRRELIKEVFIQKTHKRLRSRYQPDLMGYPQYPWLFQGNAADFVPHNYEWRSLNRGKIYSKYYNSAASLGGTMNFPDYTHHRIATQLWIADRIDLDLIDAILYAKSEDWVDRKMKICMEEIQKDLATLIASEDLWWRNMNKQNPLRLKIKKD